MADEHISVLVRECTEYLNCAPGGIYVDATLGSGGHARQILETCPDLQLLIGIDCDPEAIERAQAQLAPFAAKCRIIHGNFRNIQSLLARTGVSAIDGIVFDLGVSTQQLKDSRRGFGFTTDGELDMRMDPRLPQRAGDIVQHSSARQLEEILRTFGEERWARRIARRIRERSDRAPVRFAAELADIVAAAIPPGKRPDRIHPATKTFQALRIAVNDELGALQQGIEGACALLRPPGRMCVISFHSLEDRIVKRTYRDWARSCRCPPGMPVCACGARQRVRIVTGHPVTPSEDELLCNPRARSAKLRVCEKL